MQRSVLAIVFVLALAGGSLAGAATGAGTDAPELAQPEGFDETSFEITVYENTSARWTFEHRRALENDSEIAQFRDYAQRFETTRTDLYTSFVNRSRALAVAGSDATGRNMSAIAHSRSATIRQLGQRQGVVRLSFTWTNFGVASGDRVVIGDVFEGGLPLGANQRLVIEPGPNLDFASAQPEDYEASGETLAESDSITWFGERRFADERPHVEFLPAGAAQGDNPAPNPVMFLGLLAIVAALAVALAYRRGLFDEVLSEDGEDGGAATASGDTSAPSPPPEPEVVSDRDRVTQLLEENGGRMKQVRIVDETEWSKSKVSMLLSEMEEDGEISKLRVGRENIVSLSGHEPDAAGSPFDEE